MKYGLTGRYKIAIIDAKTKRVKWQQRQWQHNLIMNNGMDKIATSKICDCFLFAIAGNGTKTGDVVSSDFSTTATCDVAGNVVLSGGTLTLNNVAPGDFGNIIKWDGSGFEGRITTITNPTHATVLPLPSVPQTGNFKIYRTNFNTLQSEIKRTGTLLGISPSCGTTLIGNALVHQRTWDFTEEVATVTYTEVGVGWSGTLNDTGDALGGTVFARFLLHSVTAVNAGEALRVVYQLQVVLSPSTPFSKTAAISNWPIAPSTLLSGSEQIQLIGLSSVTSTGATTFFDAAQYANEPSVLSNVYVFVSTNSTANAAFGSCVDRFTGATMHQADIATSPSYTLHSYSQIKQVTFSSGEGNSAAIRSMGVGYSNQSGKFNSICFVFDQNQTKLATHTLNLQFFQSWARLLSPSSV